MSDVAFGVQDARDQEADAGAMPEERWPLRRTVLFVVVVSTGLWSTIITGLSYVV